MRTSLDPLFFQASEGFDLTAFSQDAGIPFSFRGEPAKEERLHCYETFDWRAWNKKNALFLSRRRLSVVDLKNGREICSTSLRKTPLSFFPDDIDDQKTASTLLKLSKLRAFIRVASTETKAKRWRVLDENQKTVAAVELLSVTCETQPKHFITLSPVRGYGKELHVIAEHLKICPQYLGKTTFEDFYREVLSASKLIPGSYSPKPSVKLKPRNTIQDSTRELLLSTLAVIRANEQWIPKNIDTEFLHDYRVAIRRTRSILARLKGIFPPEELSRYKQAFRELGKRTNNLRDQDVYLLQAEKFRNLLPVTMRDSLDFFFTDLRNRHKKELGTFSRYLGSQKYRLFMQEWESFLKSEMSSDPATVPLARNKTSEVAVSTTRKALKKIIRHGRDISRIATDTELHALRLDCKKLRYLLEFYASIFPAKTLQMVIGQLKELQDNLGAFVDLSVQQDYLNDYLSNLKPSTESIRLAASLGGLVTALDLEREKVRMNFHSTFDKFDRQETEVLFEELFNKYR